MKNKDEVINVEIEAISGCLLGTAIGDTLGLPYEGLKPKRAMRMLGEPLRYRFLFGKGMVSDDTEHTCLVLQSLMESRREPDRFAHCLAKRMRKWFLLLPAGVGNATARSCVKLLVGFKPEKSGVFSAGNGPAMRSAILGAAINDLEQLALLVRGSSRLTHTDPKAEQGALAVAFAAWTSRRPEPPEAGQFFDQLRQHLAGQDANEFLTEIADVEESLKAEESTNDFALRKFKGRGVSGYTLHTVPTVLHAWLSEPNDFHKSITTIIRCGGDSDTTAAILGGIVGARVGCSRIPVDLVTGLWEWPRNVEWMRHLAEAYADGKHKPPDRSVFLVLPRNLFFLTVVLFHGFRRLLPPY